MSNMLAWPVPTAFDSSGAVINGAKLNAYVTGTTTRQDTFSDAALTSANANPVVSDSAGRFIQIFLKDAVYKLVLTDENDVEIWTVDPVLPQTRLVGDTSPQLGGALDPNNNFIGWAKGGDLTSASPLVIDTDGNYFDVTGTTGFSAMTVAAERVFVLQFDDILTMTDGASLDLGGTNITTAAGDRAEFYSLAQDTAQLQWFFREGGDIPTGLKLATEQATTSGTAINFTSIPSWVKRITVMFDGVSTDGTEEIIIQLGDAGGLETTGYTGSAADLSTSSQVAGTLSAGFAIAGAGAAANVYNGLVILTLEDAANNTWSASGSMGRSDAGNISLLGGIKSLSAALTQVTITSTGTPDTFDAGAINILYE